MTDQLPFLETIADRFLSLSGKVLVTAEDYDYFRRWDDAGIPLSVATRGLEDAIERWPYQRRHKIMARNCDSSVRETHAHWKRAIGPG